MVFHTAQEKSEFSTRISSLAVLIEHSLGGNLGLQAGD